MRIALFGTKPYDRHFFDLANEQTGHVLSYFEPRLDRTTTAMAAHHDAVCVFVNDQVDRIVLEKLRDLDVQAVALRCAGYNNVDLRAADRLGISVVRVPAYSPEAVSEFTIGLLLALDRRIPRAWARVRENNFSLDGLIGHNLCDRTVGIIGTGRIGALVARALKLGFGCDVIATDLVEDEALLAMGVRYLPRHALLRSAEVISLHCPLTPDTRHVINAESLAGMRSGVQIVNTSRGALIDTYALIKGLKSGAVGGVALDVYEQEGDLFFEDLSNEVIQDDMFQRLLTFPNVLVTGHQAFLTREALTAIAETTLENLSAVEAGRPLVNSVTSEAVTR